MSKELIKVIKKKMTKEQRKELYEALTDYNTDGELIRLDGQTLHDLFYERVRNSMFHKYHDLFTTEELNMTIKYHL